MFISLQQLPIHAFVWNTQPPYAQHWLLTYETASALGLSVAHEHPHAYAVIHSADWQRHFSIDHPQISTLEGMLHAYEGVLQAWSIHLGTPEAFLEGAGTLGNGGCPPLLRANVTLPKRANEAPSLFFWVTHNETQQLYQCILSHTALLFGNDVVEANAPLTQTAQQHITLTLLPLSREGLQQVQKNEFMSIISHEFRTPLTSIQGFVDTLLGFSDRLSKEQHVHFLTIIKHQTERLSRLVERVLSLSKLEGTAAPLLKFRPVALPSLLADVEGVLKGKHGLTHSLRVHWHCPMEQATLWGEPDAIEQILVNIIDNAFKYSPNAQHIDVSVALDASDPKHTLHIAVQDYGIGLSDEHVHNLFNRFYRASHSLTQQIEGTGLGLYLTKQLVHQLQGRIEVESSLGQGSVFTVFLPLATHERQQNYRSAITLSTSTESSTVR
ncbi:MAG: sensor histidine kinase [Vampirovibrionales bacterium]